MRGFVSGLRRQDFPCRRHPSYAASIFYRLGIFTLWFHGYLQASLGDLKWVLGRSYTDVVAAVLGEVGEDFFLPNLACPDT
jgi:hypothetical protein